MYRARDIAAWLINRDNREPDEHKKNHEYITILKLMKLLYYAQGAFLAIDGVKLFDEPIEAWEYGPVVPEVYNIFKDVQAYEIKDHVGLLQGREIDGETEELLEQVYAEIGLRYTASELVTKTHRETPWLKATDGGVLLNRQRIKLEDMKEYFKEYYTESI